MITIKLSLFVHHFLPSPQPVSDGAVCLCKFHLLLRNILITNIDEFLQRGRILITFRLVKHLNINAMNKDDLFVALVFLGHTSNWPMAGGALVL